MLGAWIVEDDSPLKTARLAVPQKRQAKEMPTIVGRLEPRLFLRDFVF